MWADVAGHLRLDARGLLPEGVLVSFDTVVDYYKSNRNSLTQESIVVPCSKLEM